MIEEGEMVAAAAARRCDLDRVADFFFIESPDAVVCNPHTHAHTHTHNHSPQMGIFEPNAKCGIFDGRESNQVPI